jgi:putative ATPase
VTQAINHASAKVIQSEEVPNSVLDQIIPSSTPLNPINSSPQITDDHKSSEQSVISLPHTDHTILFPGYPQLSPTILDSLISLSNGDARVALSLLELVLVSPATTSPSNLLSSLRHSVSASFDRTGDDRYDMISALHKSVRGSDGDAALYWLARMLIQGEDPIYIARRMVICASEDIGLADNHALPLVCSNILMWLAQYTDWLGKQATATLQACQLIGMPECRINLAHLIAYLSEAPKSTRAYRAYNRAEEAAEKNTTLPVPLMIRNAPTKMMKDMKYGEEYRYNPDFM